MGASDDDIWALRAELRDLSNSEFDDLSRVVRARLPAELRVQLKADPNVGQVTGKQGVFAELQAISRFSTEDAAAALAVFTEVARQTRGAQFSARLETRRSSLEEPGRDRALGGVAEKAKVDLRDDLVPIEWLAQGSMVAASVAFLTVPRYIANARSKEVVGTGFLVGEDRQHLMTAYHVVEAREREKNEQPATPADLTRQIRETTVAFDYLSSPDAAYRGTQLGVESLVAFDERLDYAVLKLSRPVTVEPLTIFAGDLPAIDEGAGFAANIVQHPLRNGVPQPKQLGLRNNAVWRFDAEKLYYFTDTRAGSSGSPVISDGWQVLAIHTGYDTVKSASYMGRSQAFANRGSLMKPVVNQLRTKVPKLVLRVA